VFPERAGDEPQVGRLIIGSLQQCAFLGIVPPDPRQRLKHGGVADAHPQLPQQDTYHILGRYAVNLGEHVGKSGTFLFSSAFPGRLRDGSQPLKHLLDTQNSGGVLCPTLHVLCDQPQITQRRVQCRNLLRCAVRGKRDELHHAFVSHPHRQWLIERRHSALHQVADLLDFLRSFDGAKQPGDQFDQRQTGTGSFQFLKGTCKVGKFHRRLLLLLT
jgi:hypothetical protein